MKKLVFGIFLGSLFLSSCTGVKTTSIGLENEAYLEFIGKPGQYPGGVNVVIDEKRTFIGEVNRDHADRPKGKVYAVSTGNHSISVSYSNVTLINKTIFVSSQETKKIMLP